jgi:hypothetical protein
VVERGDEIKIREGEANERTQPRAKLRAGGESELYYRRVEANDSQARVASFFAGNVAV